MNLWKRFIRNERLRRFVVLLGIVLILFWARKLMNIILLTFIFSFLVIRFTNWVQKRIKIPNAVIVIVVYALIIFGLIYTVTNYVPKVISQSESLVRSVLAFYNNPPQSASKIIDYVNKYIPASTFTHNIQHGAVTAISFLTSLGTMGVTFFMSLLFSFFFTIERDETYKFSKSFLKGPFSWIFKDINYFATKFVNTFGVVLEAQFFIAVINTVVTVICLAFLGFNQLFSLGVMIFFLSMIPVAGVIVSAIPMSIIAYSNGGFTDVLYVWIMLLAIHALEAYVLNPKFMSSMTDLPIFYTFVVLFVAEDLFGAWGLIVGIPVFTFLLDIIGVKTIGGRHTKIEKDIDKKINQKKEEVMRNE